VKRAIIVKGQSDSGKSGLLIDFYDWIVTNYLPIKHYEFVGGDIHAVLQVGNLLIAFNSCGDEGPYLDNFLKDAITNNYDMIIAACRAKGATNHAVRDNLTYPNYVVDYVHTHHVPATQILPFRHLRLEELKARIIGLPKI
jgi:hypothetical protein